MRRSPSLVQKHGCGRTGRQWNSSLRLRHSQSARGIPPAYAWVVHYWSHNPAIAPQSKAYSKVIIRSVRLESFRSEFVSPASSEKTTFTMARSKRPRTTLRIGICSDRLGRETRTSNVPAGLQGQLAAGVRVEPMAKVV